MLPFQHGGIGVIDKKTATYKSVFVDLPPGSRMTVELEIYFKKGFPSNNQIVDAVLASAVPMIFDLEELERDGKLSAYSRLYCEAGMKELIMFSLRNENEPIGFFGMYSDRKRSFHKSHLEILPALSSQITIAVTNILMNEEILERENEKTLLLNLSNDIASCRTYEDVQNIVSNKLQKYFQFNEVLICLNSSDNLTHNIYSAIVTQETMDHSDFTRIVSTKYFINDGVFNVIQDSLKPVIFDMDELAGRKNKPLYIDFWRDLKVREIIGFPLRVNNETIGGAQIYPKEKNSFSPAALNIAQSVCSYIGIALNNIRTCEKIESQLEEIKGYKSQLESENQYLQEQIKTTYNVEEIVGIRGGLRHVFKLVLNVAPGNTTVLIQGETGTGKELIAAAIHNTSPRKHKLMVKLNCATLPSHLAESELFGHEKGSFTGATERRIGKFELANHGTLFLDEIGELSLDLQAKLLRALQEKEFERIGGNTVIKTDARVIAASNRDLKEEVEAGKFRSDLFYRLNVFPIVVPPLRERKEDIPLLVSYFVDRFAKKMGKSIKHISTGTVQEMTLYEWPGNVRELEHIIERAVVMTNGDTLNEISLLPAEADRSFNETPGFLSLQENERAYILSTLKRTNGKIRGEDGAARILNVPPTTLHSKMKKLGIKKIGEA